MHRHAKSKIKTVFPLTNGVFFLLLKATRLILKNKNRCLMLKRKDPATTRGSVPHRCPPHGVDASHLLHFGVIYLFPGSDAGKHLSPLPKCPLAWYTDCVSEQNTLPLFGSLVCSSGAESCEAFGAPCCCNRACISVLQCSLLTSLFL